MSSGRNTVGGHDCARLIDDGDLRVQIFLVLDDYSADRLRGLVDFLLHRHALQDVLELHSSGLFGQNRNVVRIPLDETLAFLDFTTLRDRDHGSDHHRITLEFATIGRVNADKTVLVQHDVMPFQRLHGAEVSVLNSPIILGFDLRLLKHLRGRSSDVEGTHGQLRSGLADALGGYNTDRFAEFSRLVGRQIQTITRGADPTPGFAGQCGTDLDPFLTQILNRSSSLFTDQLTGNHDFILGDRIHDVVTGSPTIDAIT